MLKTTLSLSRRPYSTQPLPAISQIKAEFSKLKGGSVDLTKEDSGLAKLVLNYPSSCNALTGWMMVELEEAVTELETWNQGRGLLLLGANNKGKYFCAGGHLETVKSLDTPEKGLKMSVLMSHVTHRLRNLSLVSASVLEGPALGGGAELASATDHRLATTNGSVAFVQSRMGIPTGFGGGRFLLNLVGYHRALDLVISGRKLGVEEGLRWGYFDGVLEEDEVEQQGRDWLERRIKFCTPTLIKDLKTILRPDSDERLECPRELESRLFSNHWTGPSHKLALNNNIKHK